MKVLMFGWEFPPYKSGGLGTACHGLCKGLSKQGVKVTFVMPSAPENAKADFVKLVGTNNISVKKVDSLLTPYMTSGIYADQYGKTTTKGGYGKDLFNEVERYSAAAVKIAGKESFDVIHAHDWMTYKAGILAKKKSGKPLVVHIHATEFDRTGNNPNQHISQREFEGLKAADVVIANSNFTKQNVMNCYKIPENKIEVVHWGIDEDDPAYNINYSSPLSNSEKIVLFLGRVTIQKGPDYFVEVAHKVSKYLDNVKFVVAGDGDMLPRMINRAAELGISDKVIFTGFLKGDDVHKAFQMADLYVMPSVAEPFGLVALESMKNGTPIIISKQSGVSEVVTHALKVDFWDIDEMTNKIVGVLRHEEALHDLRENGHIEVQKFTLEEPARKVKMIYEKVR